MLQYTLIEHVPHLLRWYRTQVTMDWPRMQAFLPTQGQLLDVGCGIGTLDFALGRKRPQLEILGIDISDASITIAQSHHTLPNVRFACQLLEEVTETFDWILFVDVLHHVESATLNTLLATCRPRLKPGGSLLIKDIARTGGQVSYLMDRYISGCREIYMRECDELARHIERHLQIDQAETHFRAPFAHTYIRASCPH